MGVMRASLKRYDQCCWVDRTAAVEQMTDFRVEMKIGELAQAGAPEVECCTIVPC